MIRLGSHPAPWECPCRLAPWNQLAFPLSPFLFLSEIWMRFAARPPSSVLARWFTLAPMPPVSFLPACFPTGTSCRGLWASLPSSLERRTCLGLGEPPRAVHSAVCINGLGRGPHAAAHWVPSVLHLPRRQSPNLVHGFQLLPLWGTWCVPPACSRAPRASCRHRGHLRPSLSVHGFCKAGITAGEDLPGSWP